MGNGIGVALLRLYAVFIALVGLALTVGGLHLMHVGGSAYYLAAGLTLLVSGVLLWLRRSTGAALYGLLVLGTIAWALWEVGYDGWSLMPRIMAFLVVGVVLLLPVIRNALLPAEGWGWEKKAAAFIAAVALGFALHTVVPPLKNPDPLLQTGMTSAPDEAKVEKIAVGNGDWRNYGNDVGGSRFSPLSEITPENASKLELVWKTEVSDGSTILQATPLKVGNALYMCNASSDVIALDAETGAQLWRHDAKVDIIMVRGPIRCRGVSYYEVPDGEGACAKRIIAGTLDARLIALDAADGKPCADFGTNGEVSLWTGMREVAYGYYGQSSAPLIANGKIVLGGFSPDNQYWGQPSGVIRGFDAVTGKLAWAWDMGRPDSTGEPPPGEFYTPSTPNAWGTLSADESLGLVYVPLGNPTPDYFAAQRRPFDEQYGTSLTALDVTTGKPRWSFQVTHHDIWDYDVSAHASLVDYPTPEGIVRAIIQPTKNGELYVLDRATGVPLKTVNEHPVPQAGAVPEERRISPTQPFSDGMPSFRGANLVEGDMWGITPLDHLWCRTKFREARYDGPYTLPGTTPSIEHPGFVGGVSWSGVSVDTARHIVVVTSSIIPNYIKLVPRPEADQLGLKPFTEKTAYLNSPLKAPQMGTPYGVFSAPFLSPLNVPCTKPPFGLVSAIDLPSGKLIWTKTLGTARESGPMGIRSRLPITLGTLNFRGGTIATQGGVFFVAAADRYFRAFETRTGKLLWETPLPAAGTATPMTYTAPSGRQFVVISSGGNDGMRKTKGDYVAAYALPKAAP